MSRPFPRQSSLRALAHLYCEDDGIATLLLALHHLPIKERANRVDQFAPALA